LSSFDRAFNLLVCDLRETGGKAMPFDGVGLPIDDRVSKIDQVINLLATPTRWCKAQFKTRDGRYCIRGAIMAVEGADFLKRFMLQAIREVTGKRYLRIESFNDHPYTRHAQVLRVLMRPSACGQSLGSGHDGGTRACRLVRTAAGLAGYYFA